MTKPKSCVVCPACKADKKTLTCKCMQSLKADKKSFTEQKAMWLCCPLDWR